MPSPLAPAQLAMLHQCSQEGCRPTSDEDHARLRVLVRAGLVAPAADGAHRVTQTGQRYLSSMRDGSGAPSPPDAAP